MTKKWEKGVLTNTQQNTEWNTMDVHDGDVFIRYLQKKAEYNFSEIKSWFMSILK